MIKYAYNFRWLQLLPTLTHIVMYIVIELTSMCNVMCYDFHIYWYVIKHTEECIYNIHIHL